MAKDSTLAPGGDGGSVSSPSLEHHRLVILYGSVGGLSDVGRHCVQAALEYGPNTTCAVLTQDPKLLLEETNWKCGCPEPHGFTDAERKRISIVQVGGSWRDADLAPHLAGATAVIVCVGNRQPFIGGWDAHAASQAVIKAMSDQSSGASATPKRVVAMSSMGIEEDWPPAEFHWGGKIMACIFMTIGRKSFRDLTLMERAYRGSDLDYLLVRPVGLGEDVLPAGLWRLQQAKYDDTSLFINIAKLDVARFMVREAIRPTRIKCAVTIGAEPPTSEGDDKESK